MDPLNRLVLTSSSFTDLDEYLRLDVADRLDHDRGGMAFFQENNPVVRHTVLRRRAALEHAGLMKRVAVNLRPRPMENDPRTRAFYGAIGRAVASTIASGTPWWRRRPTPRP